MKTILVIGKYGQIAQAFVKLQIPDHIILLSKEELNVEDWNQTKKKILDIHPDIVINTSAFHLLTACEDNPQKAFELNTLAVLNLSKICSELHTPFVTYSTDYVFDGTKNKPYTENDTPNPLQVYGISKLAGEYAALNYYPNDTWIIRTNGVYGGLKGSREKKGNFVLNTLKDTHETLYIRPDLIVSPTYANDLAQATYDLLLNPAAKPGIYHLINEGTCSWLEFAKAIVKYAKINKEVLPRMSGVSTDAIKRPIYSALENKKGKAIGINLPTWQDALKRYINKELKYE